MNDIKIILFGLFLLLVFVAFEQPKPVHNQVDFSLGLKHPYLPRQRTPVIIVRPQPYRQNYDPFRNNYYHNDQCGPHRGRH